jgi:BirA family biotin operon repressor/biotin-[acetyl-CoA-carboxylase] ligase
VLIGRAKVAGILPESASATDGAPVVVIGVGLNLAGAPAGLARAATCLADAGLVVTPAAMVARLDTAFRHRLAEWDLARGFAQIRAAWLERAGPLGEPVTVNAGTGPVTGAFGGVDLDGALLLREPHGALRRFTYGDVTVAPEVSPATAAEGSNGNT